MNTRSAIIMTVLAGTAAGVGLSAWWALRDGGEHRHVPIAAQDAEGQTYYTCAMHPEVRMDQPGNCPICGMALIPRQDPPAASAAQEHAAAAEAEAADGAYYTCPMHPEVRMDRPGQCPICGMPLVLREAAPATAAVQPPSGGIVQIDPRMAQNLGIRTAVVERRALASDLRAPGTVALDENRMVAVQTRAAGWIERLHVRALSEPVRKGQPLAELYAPELYAAQQEFLLALRSGDAGLVHAARQRLALLGLDAGQLARLERGGQAQRRVVVHAPVDGIVTELGAREGAQLAPGQTLFLLADLSRVWILAEVPEAQAATLSAGAPVAARVTAFPGEVFRGQVEYVYPSLEAATRTLRVRSVFDNPGQRLKPGMYAEVLLEPGERQAVAVVPSEALIRTGTRTVVILAEGEGRFRPVAVTAGAEQGGSTEILAGLEAGQRVVVSGQFLLDSEANLRGALGRMAPAGHEGHAAPHTPMEPEGREAEPAP